MLYGSQRIQQTWYGILFLCYTAVNVFSRPGMGSCFCAIRQPTYSANWYGILLLCYTAVNVFSRPGMGSCFCAIRQPTYSANLVWDPVFVLYSSQRIQQTWYGILLLCYTAANLFSKPGMGSWGGVLGGFFGCLCFAIRQPTYSANLV